MIMAKNWHSLVFLLVMCYILNDVSCRKAIKLGVILPFDDDFDWSIQRVGPAIELAVEMIDREYNLLEDHKFLIQYGDSKCSETFGPLAAIDMYRYEKAHVFLGPVCEYAVAPIARFSPHWDIPLITPGAMVRAFSDKTQYGLLTRIGGTYNKLGSMFQTLFAKFDWSRAALIYHNTIDDNNVKSNCHFTMEAVWHFLKQRSNGADKDNEMWYRSFNENDRSSYNLTDILLSMSKHARIVVLCGSPETVREIMIEAHELKFDQGDYVFLNIDNGEQADVPWYRESDPNSLNNKARDAYKSLITVSQRKSDTEEYKLFLSAIKRRARDRYPDDPFGDGEVSQFVGDFFDAVFLYGLALNESLAAGFDVSNGHEITKRMWGRSFQGVTGTVDIDENGDRNVDYSFLDLNPDTGKFEEVAFYYGNRKMYEPVIGKSIHWPNRDSPPPDTPSCGFDGSGCPP